MGSHDFTICGYSAKENLYRVWQETTNENVHFLSAIKLFSKWPTQ
jgi:hypothetical protein